MNYGMKVIIKFDPNSKISGYCLKIKLRNITEIHYNYPQLSKSQNMRIAFESDIHRTGFTYAVEDIKEFWTELETEMQEQA